MQLVPAQHCVCLRPPWRLEMQRLGGFALQFPFLALLSLSFLFMMEELKAKSFIPSPCSALHPPPATDEGTGARRESETAWRGAGWRGRVGAGRERGS